VKLLRAVLGRLDPWAALLLGVLLALGVVILLATPGPWHKVVGPAPTVERAPSSPTDLAVFAIGGRTQTCTAVLWFHVDHEQPAVAAVVVAPESQGFVAGGGFMPLSRMVDVAGPAAAATALGQAVGVHMDAWLTLDEEALRLALSAAEPAQAGRARVAQYQGMLEAWAGSAAPRRAWALQAGVLSENLGRVPFERTSIVGFANYVLGFGHVHSDLDLQRATSLARTFKVLPRSEVRTCAAPVIVQACREGRAWRVDPAAAARLRSTLELGELPDPQRPSLTRESSPARVLVVMPGRSRVSQAYVDEVRLRLRESGGAPVAVKAIAVRSWARLAAATVAAAREWHPLAVLVGPPAGASPAREGDAAAALRTLGQALRINWLPAVVSEPLPVEATSTAAAAETPLVAAVRASGQPVSPLGVVDPGAPDGSARAFRAAAVANVATLVRACWSGALAPDLASTRLGFSFAARRRTEVGVVAPSLRAGERSAARLRTWGFQAEPIAAGEWVPTFSGEGVYYRPGLQSAALALAGDLGLPEGAVLADSLAPAPVTAYLK
jgi:hypothetical protein